MKNAVIVHHIDHERRLVTATAHGVITPRDFFGYQREVWSRPDVANYNELVDMTSVARLEEASRERVSELAELAASMDTPGVATKLAIVANADLHFGLGRMYQSVRAAKPQANKTVGVFRTREEAMQWLDLASAPTEAGFFVQQSTDETK